MDAMTTTIGFVGLGTIAALAAAAAWPRWRDRRPSWPVRSGSHRPHQWFGGDPGYFFGGDVGSADCAAGADGGGAGCD
jgi:hypothetical protein